jgi:hypothetical protein
MITIAHTQPRAAADRCTAGFQCRLCPVRVNSVASACAPVPDILGVLRIRREGADHRVMASMYRALSAIRLRSLSSPHVPDLDLSHLVGARPALPICLRRSGTLGRNAIA